jgi:hypothetical protein
VVAVSLNQEIREHVPKLKCPGPTIRSRIVPLEHFSDAIYTFVSPIAGTLYYGIRRPQCQEVLLGTLFHIQDPGVPHHEILNLPTIGR